MYYRTSLLSIGKYFPVLNVHLPGWCKNAGNVYVGFKQWKTCCRWSPSETLPSLRTHIGSETGSYWILQAGLNSRLDSDSVPCAAVLKVSLLALVWTLTPLSEADLEGFVSFEGVIKNIMTVSAGCHPVEWGLVKPFQRVLVRRWVWFRVASDSSPESKYQERWMFKSTQDIK